MFYFIIHSRKRIQRDMKIESSNTKIQPNLMGSVVRSGILTAVTSSFVLSEMTKANIRNSLKGADLFEKSTRKSAEKTAEFLASAKKSPNLDLSKVADKLGKIDIDAVVAKAKENYPSIRKQGLKALGILTAVTAVNAIVMYTFDKIAAKKAESKAE